MKGGPKNVPAPLEVHRKGLQVLFWHPRSPRRFLKKKTWVGVPDATDSIW